MKSYSDLLVVPYAELLDSTRGLADHKGGPVFPDWDSEVASRHCRRGNQPLDVRPAQDTGPVAQLQGTWAWLGPVCHHFGHQLADFSMRILPSRLSGHAGGYLAGVRVGQPADLASTPAFFRDILDYCAVDPGRVHIVNRATRVEQMLVAPQAETIFGPPPSDDWLKDLEAHFHARTRLQGSAAAHRIVYVSRSRVVRGTIAGEASIESFLRHHGAQVIHPEDHPLHVLLPLYCAAEHVVFSEGSALHALQFLGRQLKHVTVIGRGQSQAYGANFLAPRCTSLVYVAAPTQGVSGRPDGRYREGGLAFLEAGPMVVQLGERLGLGVEAWHAGSYAAAQVDSLQRWLVEYVHARPNPPAVSGDILEEEVARLGLSLDPATLDLLAAKRLLGDGNRGATARRLADAYMKLRTPTLAALALDEAGAARELQVTEAVVADMTARGMALKPAQQDIHIKALADLGRADEAVALARQWLAQGPSPSDAPRSLTLLSAQLAGLGEHTLAQAAMQRARAAGQLGGWMWRHWAHVERRLGHLDLALARLDEALSIDAADTEALWLRVQLLHQAGRIGEALEAAHALVAMDSRPPYVALRDQLASAAAAESALAAPPNDVNRKA